MIGGKYFSIQYAFSTWPYIKFTAIVVVYEPGLHYLPSDHSSELKPGGENFSNHQEASTTFNVFFYFLFNLSDIVNHHL